MWIYFEIPFLIGFVVFCKLCYTLIQTIYECKLMRGFDLSKRYGKGSWVIITGGSSGIGFEFAKEFVKRNFNIIIIARNQDKLDKSAQEIRNLNSNVKVKTITFDFGIQSAVKDYDDLWDKIQKIETSESQISILINNVGVTWSKMSETSLKN